MYAYLALVVHTLDGDVLGAVHRAVGEIRRAPQLQLVGEIRGGCDHNLSLRKALEIAGKEQIGL